MKKLLFTTLVTGLAFILFASLGTNNNQKNHKIPKDVMKVLDKSCYGCHNSESRNEDAREELSFDKWDKLTPIKKLSKLKEIKETVVEEEMPPQRFLKKYPDKKLSEKETQILMDWVKKEMK